ncbi:MAG: glutamate-1-semialdehyde 2,1-aminomutase [Acidobacteria bacterium]|nr:glutamate-1-semialdehyde 2,1-aminomutase [Acidobacteriota bacterium]
MNDKLPRSHQLFHEATRLIPGGVNSPVRAFGKVGGTPVYFRTAAGSRFEDVDGNTYIDFCQSWGPLILGHSHPCVVEAVRDAAQRGLSYGACHEGEIRLARLILEALPEFEQVRVMNSGTEAVMTALRLARGITSRNLVIKFSGGYHGHFDGMLVKAGSGLATHALSDSSGVPADIAGTTLVAPLDDVAAVEEIFRVHGGDVAAVIIEPLPANNGLLVQRREYLQFLRDVTAAHGSLLIFDEVISGFRLRFGGYYQEVGIRPDMVTLGKIIGGGMPVGAIVGPARLMEGLAPLGKVYQAGTLSGNPVSLAAGIAQLETLRDESPYARLEQLGRLFETTLAAGGHPAARAVRMGSIIWPYLDSGAFPRRDDAIAPATVERFNRIYWPLLIQGYYLPPSAYEVLFLSAAHSEAEVTGLAGALAVELVRTENA